MSNEHEGAAEHDPRKPEIVGHIKRVLPCRMTAERRAAKDDLLHQLLDRKTTVRVAERKLKGALKKVRERLTAIEVEVEELHVQRKAPEVEELVVCRVERLATSIRVVRDDTGLKLSERPMTAEEMKALNPLPGMGAALPPRHEELEPRVADKLVEREEQRLAKRTELLQDVDVNAMIAAANDTDDEDDDDQGDQLDMPGMRPAPSDEDDAADSDGAEEEPPAPAADAKPRGGKGGGGRGGKGAKGGGGKPRGGAGKGRGGKGGKGGVH